MSDCESGALEEARRFGRFHRLLGLALFAGSLSAVVLAVVLVESGSWGERDLRQTLPIAALVAITSFTAQFVHAYSLLGRANLEAKERSQLVASMFLWGQFGMLWVVFRLTARRRREFLER
jgi:hypothetical protein